MADDRTLPEPNQEVTLAYEVRGLSVLSLRPSVYYTEKNGRIWLYLPASEQTRGLEPGIVVTVSYVRSQIFFRLQARIKSVTLSADVDTGDRYLLIKLGRPRNLEQVHRRRFFRLPIALGVRYRPVLFPLGFQEDPELRRSLMEMWVRELDRVQSSADTRDISGGGLGMYTNMPLDIGESVFVEVRMPRTLIHLPGRIVRCQEGNFAYRVGLEFVGVDTSIRDEIIHFIYDETQRRLRRGEE